MHGPSITPTPTQLRALTHPARMRMLGLLRVEGPSTATALAARLGLNTGATSYHLRQLAQHGFITDDDERGNGRERWWRAAHVYTRTAPPPPDDDAARDAEDAFLQAVVTVYAEQLQQAVEERPLLPEEWRRAGTFSDRQPLLTPQQAREARRRIWRLVEEIEDAEGPDESGEPVPFSFQLAAFPRPGHVGGDPS